MSFLSFSVLLSLWFWDGELRIWKVRKNDLVTYFTCRVIHYIQTITTVIQNQVWRLQYAWVSWCYEFWSKPPECYTLDSLICFFMLCYLCNFMLFKLSLFLPSNISSLILIALLPFFFPYFCVYSPLILLTGRAPQCPQHWELCLLSFFSKVVNFSSVHKGPSSPEHLAACPYSYHLLYKETCTIQLAGIRQLPPTDFPLGNPVRWFWSTKNVLEGTFLPHILKRVKNTKQRVFFTVSREFRSRNPTKTSKRFVLNSPGCFWNSHPQSLS